MRRSTARSRDDADRPADAHREGAGMIRRDDLPERGVRRRRRLAEQAGHEAHLEHPEPETRAGLARQQADDLVEARLEDVGGLQEDALPLGGHALRPGGECRCCARHRALCVGARAGGDLGNDVARERVAVVERFPAARGRPFAADEVLVLREPRTGRSSPRSPFSGPGSSRWWSFAVYNPTGPPRVESPVSRPT